MTRHNRSHVHPLYLDLALDVLTRSCLWIQLGQVDSARFSLTIIQFTAHAILISNTHTQQAHICKSFESPVAMGEAAGGETLEAVVADLHTGGFNYWFSFTLAYSRISHEYSSLFIIVIYLIFMFSL